MDPRDMFRQILDCNKGAFDHAFNAMAMAQDHYESMLGTLMAQAAWFPEEGKKVSNEWIKAFKKGREAYYKASQDGFKKVEEFFVTASKDKSK